VTATTQPIKIAILAMGGEGGGVLADWIVDLGEHNGYLAQTTSVPGVAQRTGATIYYVELFPRAQAEHDGGHPVLALMPLPGDVDVVLASELMEAGRAVQRGLVTPDRTTLIASTHRVYSITEKIALGDGRVDSDVLLAHAAAAAKRFVRFDMAHAAEAAGSVISAVLFGALSGTGVLPFSRAQFEATIERGGVGVKPSLKAFSEAYGRAATPGYAPVEGPVDASVAAPTSVALDGTAEAPVVVQKELDAIVTPPRDPRVRALLERVHGAFPSAARPVLLEGLRRLIDYQDPAYGELYLDRMTGIGKLPTDGSPRLLIETARHLALWMSYEDTIRVAQLKTRASRFERVRGEVRVNDDQLLTINEYMHPRLQEICETLPKGLGSWLERSGWPRRLVERLTQKGRVIATSSLRGFLLLYAVAGMKRWRRSTLRYASENAAIEQWLRRIAEAAVINPQLAVEVAQCQRLVKGYSDTYERGVRNFATLMTAVDRAGGALAPATLRELRDAALADEHGDKLRAKLAQHALA
jgi:indolepyruvate ferredoxin oxidoreductase beta subunit